MSCRRVDYPFTAIVGQERMKKALILNAVNPNIGGVLIRGQKGTAKSTAVRALANLLPEIETVQDCIFTCNPAKTDGLCSSCSGILEKHGSLPVIRRKMKVIDLPLGATEDRVVGTLNIEHAIKKGEKMFEPGILASAHRGILYVDEVNLLDDHLVDVLLDSAALGMNYVEREGVSFHHPSKFILVGTMNPEEGEPRPQLLDRFGLCVQVEGIPDPAQRVGIMERFVRFENDPHVFENEWKEEERKLSMQIACAKELFPSVTYNREILELIASIAVDMGVDGHRADIFMLKVAQTLAAYAQRRSVKEEDVKEAAELVLAHRMRKKPFQEPHVDNDKLNESIENHKKKTENLNRQPQQKQHQQQNPDNKQEDKDKNPGRVQEQVFTSGEPYNVKPIRLEKEKEEISGSGRRSESESRNKSGRYIKSSIPKGKTADLAFDATIRAAAPYQVIREKNGNALTLEKQDIREKVRKKKTGSTILFVVDSSGSMGINKRMAETKTAIFSLLVDAYQKRDKVGMLVFKQNNAELILSPTSSVELARKQLETIPTGGKTPLSKGLLTGYECMLKEMNKYKSIKPVIVLISDGKANVSIASGAKPFEEAKHIAEQIRRSGIKTIVIDTETGFLRLGKLQELSRVLDAKYFRLEELKAETIVNTLNIALDPKSR